MKKLLIFLALLTGGATAQAAPGDTTWVNVNDVQLSWYGNYDSTIVFPATTTTYRRIYMIFTLGKYACGGSGYCGDWDYTVMNYLIKPGGERFELGRLITPYANAGAPRTPWTWTQHYVYDVTDYASKLRDTATIRILYSGYSGGFTGNIKFAFIEGVPDRNAIDVRPLWSGSFAYGDTTHHDSNNINVHFPALSQTAPAGTQVTDLKFTVTGHGADNNYCSEFCSHDYKVRVNGAVTGTRTIWRDDCGKNQLWPQSGTWVYDRGNWCPGAMVYSHHNYLPGISGGTSFNTQIEFDAYAGTGSASYTTEATIIYYGAMNKALDVTLEDIIAPSNDENHYRENPICGKPVIHVKNTGANAITTMTIDYGVQGMATATYNWTGTLASLAETDIELPQLPDLGPISGTTTLRMFTAKVTAVNGGLDNDTTNNSRQSYFNATPAFPSSFQILMKTNNEPVSASSTLSETSWVLYDMNNTVVYSRTNAQISTFYMDTVRLAPGCYRLALYDSSCNGLQWWANDASVTDGTFFVRKLTGVNIALRNYMYGGTYNNDFGCTYSQYFYTDWPAGVDELAPEVAGLMVYPNPARDIVHIDLSGLPSVNGVLTITDAMGRVVYNEAIAQASVQLATSRFAAGAYVFTYTDVAGNRLRSQLVIAR